MPQVDDKLLDELPQKLRSDESEEDPLKYVLEKRPLLKNLGPVYALICAKDFASSGRIFSRFK